MLELTLTNDEPTRIDIAVAEALSTSRSKVQKAVKASQVLVGGQSVTPHLEVRAGSIITYDPAIFAKKVLSTEPPPVLSVLYEDDDVIVINKPAGLLVHETENSIEPTLVDALIAMRPDMKNVGDQPHRSGLVHRLDKAASGVMIVAKTNDALAFLKKQFKDRETSKKYTVLVDGVMEKEVNTLLMPISRSKHHGRMAAKPESQGGKEAVTHYEVVKQYPHHALLYVTIETGRTHQIRAHMFSINHPVVGDTLYRTRGSKPREIGRLFLHARELTVNLPSGERKTFTAPLPPELEQVLLDIPKR